MDRVFLKQKKQEQWSKIGSRFKESFWQCLTMIKKSLARWSNAKPCVQS